MSGAPFTAQLGGRCPACGERIRAGEDEIVRTEDGRYLHAEECAEEWEG